MCCYFLSNIFYSVCVCVCVCVCVVYVCVCVTKLEPHIVSVFVFSTEGNFDPQGTLSNVW